METNDARAFIAAQIAAADTVVKQCQVMQLAWRAGGTLFKDKLESATMELGSWLAVKTELEKQLNALLSAKKKASPK